MAEQFPVSIRPKQLNAIVFMKLVVETNVKIRSVNADVRTETAIVNAKNLILVYVVPYVKETSSAMTHRTIVSLVSVYVYVVPYVKETTNVVMHPRIAGIAYAISVLKKIVTKNFAQDAADVPIRIVTMGLAYVVTIVRVIRVTDPMNVIVNHTRIPALVAMKTARVAVQV